MASKMLSWNKNKKANSACILRRLKCLHKQLLVGEKRNIYIFEAKPNFTVGAPVRLRGGLCGNKH